MTKLAGINGFGEKKNPILISTKLNIYIIIPMFDSCICRNTPNKRTYKNGFCIFASRLNGVASFYKVYLECKI